MIPCSAWNTPTMIIMMAANKMNPTAVPLVASWPLALDGYASSVILGPSLVAVRRATSGRPLQITDCTLPPGPVTDIIHSG
jgi:hypothetical protein